MPSKTFLWAGEILHHVKHHGISGIELELKKFDFQKIVQDELSLVEKLRQEKYEKVLKSLEYVTAIEGKAKFISTNEVEVNGSVFAKPACRTGRASAGREKLSAEKFIVATGSTATVPPIEGIHEVGFVTHIEALKIPKQPKSLVVVGAGPLGLEFGQMFSRFGTQVTILQRGQSILPQGEKELTERLKEILEKEGVVIKTNVEVKSARLRQGFGGQVRKAITYTQADLSAETLVEADEILLAAGKTYIYFQNEFINSY